MTRHDTRYGTRIVIISGQKYAGEVATLASAYLDMSSLSITPISTSTHIKDDFFLPLEIYRMRDRSSHSVGVLFIEIPIVR